MVAAQCLGGVPVPLYQDAPAADMALRPGRRRHRFRASSRTRSRSTSCSRSSRRARRCAHIVYDDPRGMRHYEQPSLALRQAAGGWAAHFDRANPGFFEARGRAQAAASDIAVMLYTSGTTGKPKGVCSTHAALIAAARGGVELRQAHERRQRAVLPADGLGRRQPVLARAGARGRLHRQLPRVGRHGDDRHARDRPDLLLRAAARVREPADAGDDPHGGRRRDQALAVSSLHGAWRAAAAPRSWTASRCRRWTACTTRWATSWSTARCAMCSA